MLAQNVEDTAAADLDAKITRKVNLDSMLVEELGQCGKFQLRLLLLVVVVIIFTAWASSEYVFTTARITTRCLIPECDGAELEFSPPWVTDAIPEGSGGLDNCQRYGNTSQSAPPDSCPAELFDRTQLMPCQDYVYENTETIVYDANSFDPVRGSSSAVGLKPTKTIFGLGCAEWRRSAVGSFRTVGSLLGLPLAGWLSDRCGRRVALSLSAVSTACLGALRYFTDTYIGFTISEVLEAVVGAGCYSSAYILLVEVVGPKYRVVAGATVNTSFSVGQMLMGLIAWAVPNWRPFTLALYVPMFTTVAYFWIMSESVRWYMSKGRYDGSEALLQKIAEINGRTLSPESLVALRQNNEDEKKKNKGKTEPWLLVLVFKHRSVLLRCVVSPVWWITMTFIYYGLSINAVNISGNRYINYIAVAAADVPGYWTSVFLIGRIGRKPALTGTFWLCAACQFAYVFLPNGYYGLSLTFYLFGKYCIACVATAVYVYTSELYPTEYRHSLFAFSTMMGRLGSIAAPLTPALSAATFDSLPFVLFGSFALFSGILIFLTPETLGTTLPDTMKEAEDLANVHTLKM